MGRSPPGVPNSNSGVTIGSPVARPRSSQKPTTPERQHRGQESATQGRGGRAPSALLGVRGEGSPVPPACQHVYVLYVY